MTAFESKTPPWVDLLKFQEWLKESGVSFIRGEDDNKTDGGVHYILSHGERTHNLRANYWNWEDREWQKAVDWVENESSV